MKQAIENLSLSVQSIDSTYKEAGLSVVEKSIEPNVHVSTAYTQWTQFEECPRFIIEGVDRVWKET